MRAKDRAFLAKHQRLKREDEREVKASDRGGRELVEVAGEVRRDTDKAYHFFDGTRAEWIPKSQARYDASKRVMEMPEWLAKEKGFI